MSGTIPLAVKNVRIGVHQTGTIFGYTVNLDTLWSTAVAGLVVVVLGLLVARRATSGVPSKPQLIWETIVDGIQRQVEGSIGPVAPFVVPLAITLFVFILVANWIELIPTGHEPEYLPPPTADVNLTFAMSILVWVLAIATGIRRRGLGSYLRGFFKPYWMLFPINVIEEIAKPVSLSLRLFGNLFAGGIMLIVISLMPFYILWAPNTLWKLFDMFIGLIQAFIFALLTILYFAFALGEGH